MTHYGPPSAQPPAPPIQYQPKPRKPWYKRVWLWVAVVAVLLFAGCATLVGAAGNSINDDLNNNVGVTESHEGNAMSDVKLVKAHTGQFGSLSATVKVTNSTDKQQDYVITVSFEAPDKSQIDTGIASVSALQPGQSTTTEAESGSDAPKTKWTARVAEVTRTGL
jgi:hypothetical protein